MKTKVLIIIPAYNEEETVQDVIKELRHSFPSADILLVDDGSIDSTAKSAEREASFCLRLPYHLGMGAALQTGYLFARERNYDFVVHFDADGQHLAEEIKRILEPVQHGECDLALGSRFVNSEQVSSYPISFARRLASKIVAKSFYILVHRQIQDPTSGFRAMNKNVVNLFCHYYPCDYPEVEELLLLSGQGLRIKEIPVKMRSRLKGKTSLTTRKSLFYMFKIFLVLFIDRLWIGRIGK